MCLRDCASIAGEIFDPVGRTVPVTVGFKVDLSQIHRLGFTWDDELPDNIRSVWADNFEIIQEFGTLKYKRVIVPSNAKNLDIVTLDFGDASNQALCVAIYARFELKDGSYSCHLVFARSKIVPDGTTTPRGELMAASMNAATGYTMNKLARSGHTQGEIEREREREREREKTETTSNAKSKTRDSELMRLFKVKVWHIHYGTME